MIRFKAGGIPVSADFGFFAVIAVFLRFDATGYGMLSLAACAVHEAGHLIAALIRGERIREIALRGGGIKITAEKNGLFVLFAGSLVNLALFFILYFLLPRTDIRPVMFAVLNLIIGVFNLLPVGCLDGKLILSEFLPAFIPETAVKTLEAVAFLSVIACLIAAVFFGKVNFTLIIVLIYIMAVDIFVNVW